MENEVDNLTPSNEIKEPTVHPYSKENLIGFNGRINRMDYAILWFSVWVIEWLLYKQSGLNPITTAFAAMTDPESLTEKQGLIGAIILFATAAAAYVSVKRFQDIGYSGFMALIFITPLVPLGLISLLLGFVIIVLKAILLFAPGHPDSNQYGAPPAGNHKNKILLLFIVLFLLFMLYSSFSSEAMPIVQPMLEEMMEQNGAS